VLFGNNYIHITCSTLKCVAEDEEVLVGTLYGGHIDVPTTKELIEVSRGE
jgi:hypothetical protein